MSDLSNTRLRGYEIQTVLGTGGFGVVYRAYQPVIDRLVAIKAIHPDFVNNPDFVRRFEREAQFIARLEHLHIVPIYDYWRDPYGAFLVMRLMLGGNLGSSLYHNGPWGLDMAARLVDQIASALSMAHDSGIVHQDIKPENILLDRANNAYLTDFGIAKDLTSGNALEIEVYGSPAYVSPEHAMRTVITPRSDIYSFGLLAFALLIGVSPFQDQSITTMLNKAIHNPVPPASSIRPGLNTEVDRVIRTATNKNPLARYDNPLTFAADFRYALSLSDNIPFHLNGPRVTPLAEGDTIAPLPQGSTAPVQTRTPPKTFDLSPIVAQVSTPPSTPAHTSPLRGRLMLKNPFKGLRAFDESDAPDFHGRDTLIAQLVNRMKEVHEHERFLAVVGASGSGKSSVVKAGLIPALRRGMVEGADRWFITHMVPGANPLVDLEQAVLRVAFGLPETPLGVQFASRESGLHDAISQLVPGDDTELLLFVDQFEEVFVLPDDTQRTYFLNNLYYAVTAENSRFRLVITLRADFYDRPLMLPNFGDLMRTRTEVVLPLSPAELEKAIERPALNAGLVISDDLKASIVAEVHRQPGALPLLQFTLTELFERRDGSHLTQQAYRDIGGVSGSLAKRADELFLLLDPYRQEITRKIFLRLVALGGDGTDDTRRRALRTELMSVSEDRDIVEQILTAFGRYRLLTFDRDPTTRTPNVEIAHEALIRQWARLHDWLDASRDELRIQQRLSAATSEWLNSGQDASFLARGARLVQFDSLLSGDTLALTEDERAFVRSSIRLREQSTRRLRLFIATLIVATLAAVISAGVSFDRQQHAEAAQQTAVAERNRANDEAQISRSRELALAALGERNRLDESLLISLAALQTRDTLEARRSLLTGLLTNRNVETFFHADGALRTVAVSPDGRWAASAGDTGTIVLWNLDTKQAIAEPLRGHAGTVWDVAISPDGARLASAGQDGSVRVWDVSECVTGRNTACRVPTDNAMVLDEHEGEVWSVAFSPDGNTLASGDSVGMVLLWDLETDQPEALHGHADTVFAVAFSPDGRTLASGGADRTILLWDLTSEGEPTAQVLQGHENWVLSLAFNPSGALLASAGAESKVYLWDVAQGELRGSFNANHTDWIRSLAFAPGVPLVATASADNTLRLWDLSTLQPVGDPLRAHTDAVWDVAFLPGGEQLMTASVDASSILWSLRPQQRIAQRLTGHTEPVWTVSASPDGRWLASGGGATGSDGEDFSIRLWDMQNCQDAPPCIPTLTINLSRQEALVTSSAFSPDGHWLASGSVDRSIRVWDMRQVSPSSDYDGTRLIAHQGSVTSLVFSPDGQLFSSDDRGVIIQWTYTDDGMWQPETFAENAAGVTALAFSLDGQILLAGGQDGSLSRWQVADAASLHESLQPHQDEITSLAVHPDGVRAASGSRDGTIVLLNVQTGTRISQPLRFHTSWVNALAFSPDGSLLASGSRDQTIMLWDVRSTPQMLGPALVGHTNWVNTLDFTPDGHYFASGGWDSTVYLWDVRLDTWVSLACQMANRELSPAEWERLGGTASSSSMCVGRRG